MPRTKKDKEDRSAVIDLIHQGLLSIGVAVTADHVEDGITLLIVDLGNGASYSLTDEDLWEM